MRLLTRFIVTAIILVADASGSCQILSPSQINSVSPSVRTLKGDGEVFVLLTPTPLPHEIVVDLPGLPEDATPLVLIRIPAGIFMMGSTDGPEWSWCSRCEQPVHKVSIRYDFYMGKFEVTQAQWLALMRSWPDDNYNPNIYSRFGPADNYPACFISWNDCQNFVTELNKLGQGTFRLPSEAEWEYACRAGTTTRFYFGDSDGCGTGCNDCAAGVLPGNRSDYMWYCGNNSPYELKSVGRKQRNSFGLYDMHGNVLEWCQDYWHEGYNGAPADGSAWESPASLYRVFRGGDWDLDARDCRSARRYRTEPNYRYCSGGFRLVWTQ